MAITLMGKKSQQNSKKKTIITVVALVVVIIFGLWLTGRYQVRKDAERFHDADQKKQQVFDVLVQKVGDPIQQASKDVCHNSEQGPYDNGNLWCYISNAAYYSEVTDENDIKAYAKDILKQQGVDIRSGSSENIMFDAAEDVTCNLEIYDGTSAVKPGHNLPENNSSKQTIVVSCADRAKAKHYTYIDY